MYLLSCHKRVRSVCHVIPAVFHLLQHRFAQMSSTRTKSVASCSTVDGVFDYDLPHILKERVVDTPGHKEVQEVRGVAGYLFVDVGVWQDVGLWRVWCVCLWG